MTNDFDDRANDEADRHAQMMQMQMQMQRKADSVSSADPMIDWTTADYQLQSQRDKNKGNDDEIQ